MGFGCLFLHKYTWYASGCETEYVWGTCVDLIPAYLYHWRTLAEVESIKAVKCRHRVYERQSERFSGAYCFTNTHMIAMVVRQNMCGVSACLESGISPWFKDVHGSWEHNSSDISSPVIQLWISAVFRSLWVHKYIYDGSGCETEYVWGTCVDLIRAYLYHFSTLTQGESIRVVQNRNITVKSIVC